jgi:hypothetical protein
MSISEIDKGASIKHSEKPKELQSHVHWIIFANINNLLIYIFTNIFNDIKLSSQESSWYYQPGNILPN